jgi:hypothetical protein
VAAEGSFSGFLNVLGCSIVLGLSGRHPIEKFGERWCGGGESLELSGAPDLLLFFCRLGPIHAPAIRMHSVRGQTSLERSAFSMPPHMNESFSKGATLQGDATPELQLIGRKIKRNTFVFLNTLLDKKQ